ncbi:MAG: hypothetical protein HGB01_10155 [Chlorobiaceae bacterium]|nr:hypothetical protein [Chlorobiaceae bacterium]
MPRNIFIQRFVTTGFDPMPLKAGSALGTLPSARSNAAILDKGLVRSFADALNTQGFGFGLNPASLSEELLATQGFGFGLKLAGLSTRPLET